MTAMEGLREALHEFEIKSHTAYLEAVRQRYAELAQAMQDAMEIIESLDADLQEEAS